MCELKGKVIWIYKHYENVIITRSLQALNKFFSDYVLGMLCTLNYFYRVLYNAKSTIKCQYFQ